MQVQKCKLGMIQKLMESFDIDTSKLVGSSTFDINTLTVMTKYGDVKGQAYGYFVLLAVCSAICSAKFGFFCQAEHMNG